MAHTSGEVFQENGIYYYVTSVGDSISSIAEKTGVSKEIIRKLNKDLENQRRIYNGTVVKLSDNDSKTDPIIGVGAKMVSAAVNGKNNGNNSAASNGSSSGGSGGSVSDSSASENERKTTGSKGNSATENDTSREKQKQIELKKNQYLQNIKNAQDDFDREFKAENDKFSAKNDKLSADYKDDSDSLEADMAKNKISQSSISENETKKLLEEYVNSKKQLSSDLESKIEKLKSKLQRKVESENNKINGLQ